MNHFDLMKLFDLQMFEGDGGGAAAGAASSAAGDGAVADSGDDAPETVSSRKKRNPLADVKYGRQAEDAAPADGNTAQDAKAPDPAAEWADIRNKKYKAQFDADVQGIVQKRLGAAKDAEARMEKLQPMLAALAKKAGVDVNDLDAISKSVTDDDSLYEDEALQRGVSVETLRQIKTLEADNARYKEQEAKSLQEQQFQNHIARLAQQGEALKQTYPGFDLRTELQNEQFARLTSPNVGVDVRTAYEIIHKDEILPAAMQYAVQKTAQNLAANQRARGSRPVEAGARRQAAVDVRDDPAKWSKQDRAEVRRRVALGEKIVL